MSPRPMIAAFGMIDGQLAVGGMPLERLTARIGSTPFFAYDRRLLSERIEVLRATLPPTVKVSYAVKANPMPAVLHHLAGLVDGMDVASTREMRTALDTGMPAGAISFAGPGKTEAEIDELLRQESRSRWNPRRRPSGWSAPARCSACAHGSRCG